MPISNTTKVTVTGQAKEETPKPVLDTEVKSQPQPTVTKIVNRTDNLRVSVRQNTSIVNEVKGEIKTSKYMESMMSGDNNDGQ